MICRRSRVVCKRTFQTAKSGLFIPAHCGLFLPALTLLKRESVCVATRLSCCRNTLVVALAFAQSPVVNAQHAWDDMRHERQLPDESQHCPGWWAYANALLSAN